jgi:hypothetical protein
MPPLAVLRLPVSRSRADEPARIGVESFRYSQWIVMNNDDHHRRDIRTVVDRMVKFARGHGPLFAGRQP